MSTIYLNAETLGISRFTGGFSALVDICSHLGTVYGASATKLFSHAGASDDEVDIAAHVSSGWVDFRSDKPKNIIFLDLHGLFSEGVSVLVSREHEGKLFSQTYSCVRRSRNAEGVTRIPLGHWDRGLRWKIKISNRAGGSFLVRQVQAFVQLMHREK